MLRQTHSVARSDRCPLSRGAGRYRRYLSLDPVLERAGTRLPKSGQVSVAALAEAVTATHGEVDRIVKTASGSVVVYYFDGDRAGADFVDPATGQTIGPYEPSGFIQFVTNLHRSFLMDDVGRAAAGIGALAMVVLAISGAMMLAARSGGWTAILTPDPRHDIAAVARRTRPFRGAWADPVSADRLLHVACDVWCPAGRHN